MQNGIGRGLHLSKFLINFPQVHEHVCLKVILVRRINLDVVSSLFLPLIARLWWNMGNQGPVKHNSKQIKEKVPKFASTRRGRVQAGG